MPDDRTIKQSLPVEPADLEACVRDERWQRDWIFRFCGVWVIEDADGLEICAESSILAAAQAALNEVRE
jgi:hypothetical protein